MVPDWTAISDEKTVDLGSIKNGGLVVECNDMFFGPKDNLIMPGRGKNMGDGWETKRKREPGHDWVIIELGTPGVIDQVDGVLYFGTSTEGTPLIDWDGQIGYICTEMNQIMEKITKS